jgi:hypothetical protein
MSNARELAELSGSYGTGGFVGMKNRIINGAMMIDQRNAGASVNTANGGYCLDRWQVSKGGGGAFLQQQSLTAPSGFSTSLYLTPSTVDSSIASTDYYTIRQPIEGYNTVDFGWGAAGASDITVSFWVRSSLTGLFGACITNGNSTRSYPFNYTISAAGTWEYKTVTIAGDTSGTWGKDNTTSLVLVFDLGSGSNFQGTADTWASTQYRTTSGCVQPITTSGSTWYVTGVQLEKGSTATSFDYRPYGTELALCQRYYQICTIGFVGAAVSGNYYGGSVTYPVQPRTSTSNAWISSSGLNSFANSAGAFGGSTVYGTFYYKQANATNANGASFADVFSVSSEL